MLEPPSASLLKTLAALKLCTPSDLRRCRPIVKRVSRDLPAFDSVWIDALVRLRRLTPFQAECLEAGQAERLVIGPCLLLERLGRSPFAETYLARQREANEFCVLKLTSISAEQFGSVRNRFERFIRMSQAELHPGLVGPRSLQQTFWPTTHDPRLVSISRYVSGPHLAELLIRRGRLPIRVVIELGRELLAALAALETHQAVHGDINLTNVRITASGQAVLVDTGHVPAVRPEFSFHTMLAAERYDGLAPERIAGLPPTLISDLYSLGCLMWQLLAGRPPFLAGDPLAKLAAHQTQPIPDIRDVVPDVPDELAERLLRWTSLNPAARGSSMAAAVAEFGEPTRSGRRLIAAFRGEFDRSPPRVDTPGERTGWPIAVASLLVLAGAAVPLSNPQARGTLMSWIRPRIVTASSERTVSAVDKPTNIEPAAELRPLPTPNSSGQIHLPRGGRFIASHLTSEDHLELIGDPRGPAEIIVTDQSLRLTAERVTVRNIRFVRGGNDRNVGSDVAIGPAEESPRPAVPLLMTECQDLEVADAVFDLSGADVTDSDDDRQPAAVAWRLRRPNDRRESQIQFSDCVIHGAGPGMYLAQPPAKLVATNVLKSGRGDAIQLIDPGQAPWQCVLRQWTLRNDGSWLRSWLRSRNGTISPVTLTAEGCVWDVGAESARQSLIVWMSPRLPTNSAAVEWNVSGFLVPPQIDITAVIDPTDGQRTVVDDSRWNLNGLVATRVQFAGAATLNPSDSALTTSDAPRSAKIHYGVDVSRLPATEATTAR